MRGLRLFLPLILSSLLLFKPLGFAASASASTLSNHIVGMYIHEHWPYNHPYAARTWTLDDWRGYADGLKKLGFNAIIIWPMIDIMPDPLTPSDKASLEKDSRVINMLHHEFGMRVMMVLTANVVPDDKIASQSTFQTRHFFYCDKHVNPADPAAVAEMIRRRKKLMRYLAQVDGVAIIDSDPGGYPGSTDTEFVNLLVQHRKMLNEVRPGIELDYWVDWGWQTYGRFYKTGVLKKGKDSEFLDTLRQLRKANPEPWGLANGLSYAKQLGLQSRVISFNYGRIEAEPSFPMTNFGGNRAYRAGSEPGPRGVMGNAQTHCVQLPNTFAFARGATGKNPPVKADYIRFANELIEGRGQVIVEGWEAVSGTDSAGMRRAVSDLRNADAGKLVTGPLRGLLFGDPHRFLNDLIMQLDAKAAYEDFLAASNRNQNVKPALAAFVDAASIWQQQNGFQGDWHWAGMQAALEKLHSPEIDDIYRVNVCLLTCPPGAMPMGYKDVKDFLYRDETMTTRLLSAMRDTLRTMP